ncbi:MAG: bifunctional glutamate N-acetyltransferase/amino-acid acetyltransferase ArgJ [Actinomycetota bacterium]
MSVTFPAGFTANGVTAGLKPSGRPDLGLLAADGSAAAAGMFTTNVFSAAPVNLTRQRLQQPTARAVLVNSGNANANRGDQGDFDALLTTASAAAALGAEPDDILAASTGVIGGTMDTGKIQDAMPELVAGLAADGGARFAEAICTTDTVVKEAQAEVGPYRVGACGKGAAMVEPKLDLATMLVFFTTDALLSTAALRMLAKTALKPAFEQLTIDGCTSTNDTVLVLASGAAGGPKVGTGSKEWNDLASAFREMGDSLAYQMAADAEGGTKVLLVDVVRARSNDDAQVIAKAIANSVLVKTAIFGADPNPGRLVQAIGSSGARFDPTKVRVWLGDVMVMDGTSMAASYDDAAAHIVVKQDEISVRVDCGGGPANARAIGCDLSYDYVKINADYTT